MGAVTMKITEQHEHHVDERHNVDLGEGARDPRRPAAPGLPAGWRVHLLELRHYVKFRSAMFRNSIEKSSIHPTKVFT